MSSTTEHKKCFIAARAIRAAVDNFVLVNNTLSVTACSVIVGYHNEMDAVNMGAWLESAGTKDELFCMASEGSFVRGEPAYDEAQSTVDCTAPSEVQKKLQMRQRVPTVAHLEQSDCGIVPELSKHDADRSLAGLIVSDQMQRQPALNAGCAAMDVMIPSQGTDGTGSRVLVVDQSLAGGQHLGRCRKTIQERQGVPTIAHLELSYRGIAPELSNHYADCSLVGLIASEQVQRQPASNRCCSAVDAMVPSQGTNTTGSRVLPGDNSPGGKGWGWTAPWEVQENNARKAGACKC